MLQSATERKLSQNHIFMWNCFCSEVLCCYIIAFPLCFSVTSFLDLIPVCPCLSCAAYFAVGRAGVSIPLALHMEKISEENQYPSRSRLGLWHCPGLGVGHCFTEAPLWGLSALKNLFVYPCVRSDCRSWALLLFAHQGPELLPLATDKNCC